MSKVMSPKNLEKRPRKEKENPTRESANRPRQRPRQLEKMQSAPQEDSQHAQAQKQVADEQELEPITVSAREPLRASAEEGGLTISPSAGGCAEGYRLPVEIRHHRDRHQEVQGRRCALFSLSIPSRFLFVANILASEQKLTGVGAHDTNDRKPAT